MKLSNDDLIYFLKSQKFEPEIQQESGLIFIKLAISETELPMFFVLQKDSSMLQLVTYFPFKIKHSAVANLSRVLHMINHGIDLPGYGMDEKEGVIFYRCAIPCFEDYIEDNILASYIGTSSFACESFLQAIRESASGAKQPEDFQ